MGQGYTAADQGKIENKGQQLLHIVTNEGRQGKTCCQIGDVNRPLMSVSQVADAGNIVMMSSDGGWVYYLHDESWIRVRRQHNVYGMDLWLRSNDANGKDVLKRSGFTRPGL